MKAHMRSCFVPSHYTRDLFNKLQMLSQGTKTVEEYFKQMELNMIRANVEERDEQTMARFLNGLNHPIERITEFQRYNNMVELVHIASKAERQVQEDIKFNKPKTYFTYKQAPTTTPTTPSGSSSSTTKLPFKPTLPQGKHPQVANTQGIINHSPVNATSVEAKGTSRMHVETRKFCSSMTTAMKNT